MSYIGKSPSIGSYSMLDSLSASATASYSLTLDSVAFVPESANHLLVSLNGVIQKAGSSFTVSGSTLTFSSALTSSDSIDFVLALGNVLDIGTPSDATVTNAKTNFVSTSSSAGLDIKGDGTTAGTLRLMCEQGSHGVKIASPAHSAGQSYTLTLPTGNVTADKFLKVASVSGSGATGIGQLSFADAGKTVGLGFYTDYTANLFSSTSYTQHPGFIFNYDIQESGSLIFFRLTASVRNDSGGGNRYMTLKLNYHQNGGTDTTLFERALNSSEADNGTAIFSGTFTSSSTGQCQFRLYVKSSGSGLTVRIPADYGVQGTFLEGQVLEIGQ